MLPIVPFPHFLTPPIRDLLRIPVYSLPDALLVDETIAQLFGVVLKLGLLLVRPTLHLGHDKQGKPLNLVRWGKL